MTTTSNSILSTMESMPTIADPNLGTSKRFTKRWRSRGHHYHLGFSEAAFEDFQRNNEDTISEGKVMNEILPTIRGGAKIPTEVNLRFTNIQSITEEATVAAQPDLFDGARFEDLHKEIRKELDKTVIPTKHPRAPIAPNFFLEAKAPKGGTDVAKRQVTHDFAIGARGMHALQNYREDEAFYDGNSYTYGSTYHAGTGTLQLYACHMTGPATTAGGPEYHVTQLKAYAVTSDRETYVNGAGALRNLRDLAKEHRGNFI